MTVAQNQWHRLDIPEIGAWSPKSRVSIIVPAKGNSIRVGTLVRSLGRQTYPPELLEIVVVDDGSEPALELPDRIGPVPVITVRRESDGTFGAGGARNLGASSASGDVLVFLDSDLLAGPSAVESLARWCIAEPAAMVTALLAFFDDETLPSDELDAAIDGGSIASLLNPISTNDQSWRDKTFTRTHDLTTDTPDLFRIVIGAVMAMRRDLFEQLGGLRELGMRGIEDTEFGFRAHTAGALLILDRQAELWHQGRRHFDSRKAATTRERRKPLLQDLIAAPGFRTSLASCPSVPTVMVDLRWADELAQIEPWLITSSNDVRFLVDGPQHADKRVTSASTYSSRDRAAVPYFARPRDSIRVGRDTLDSLVEHLRSNMLGVLHVVDEDGEELLEVTATRAIGRAALAGVDRDDWPALVASAGNLFGEWWVPSGDVGINRAV